MHNWNNLKIIIKRKCLENPNRDYIFVTSKFFVSQTIPAGLNINQNKCNTYGVGVARGKSFYYKHLIHNGISRNFEQNNQNSNFILAHDFNYFFQNKF